MKASDPEKLSTHCRSRLAGADPDDVLPVLLRPPSEDSRLPTSQGPTDLLDALQSAGQTMGTGPRLSHELRYRLQRRTASLRTVVPRATPLWLADALAVRLPAREVARLSHRDDVRQIDLQPAISPARNITAGNTDAPSVPLELEVPHDSDHPPPRVALIDAACHSPPGDRLKICVGFDREGRPTLDHRVQDLHGRRWLDTLANLIPDAELLAIHVFDSQGRQSGDQSNSTAPLEASYAQVVAGLQLALEQRADVILLDLGEAALDPIWHLPWLNCTLQGTTVVVAGCDRRHPKNSWPVHLPLAGCFAEGPLRTDILASGAPLGPWHLTAGLAAATRTAAAITLIQSAAPQLRRRPDALVGLLFAGPQRGLSPDGDVELDAAEALKTVFSVA